jgi:hypothetical protein
MIAFVMKNKYLYKYSKVSIIKINNKKINNIIISITKII